MDSLFPPRSLDGIDDVVIVGAGFAGLVCALRLAPRPVTLVTSSAIGENRDRAFFDPSDSASPGDGDGFSDRRAADAILSEAPVRLEQLAALGISIGEAGNARPAAAALAQKVRASQRVQLLEGFIAEQLRTDDTFVTGLVVRDRRGGLSDRMLVPARAIVLATGGIAGLYGGTHGGGEAFGEGLGMAARAGALIADAEFIRFCAISDRADDSSSAASHIGGVHVDGRGRTTLDGLWACGEVACTGAGGAGANPDISVQEALVVAARAAEDVLGQMPRQGRASRIAPPEAGRPFASEQDGEALSRLAAIMRRHVGPIRDRRGLVSALAGIARLLDEARSPRLRNALTAAQSIAAAALLREESRGMHRRSDFPAASPRFEGRTFLTRADAEAAARGTGEAHSAAQA